jgi:DNA replication initiation complex subunit (GINS family)
MAKAHTEENKKTGEVLVTIWNDEGPSCLGVLEIDNVTEPNFAARVFLARNIAAAINAAYGFDQYGRV